MSTQSAKQKGLNIKVELSEDVATGTYSNFVMINHNETEFVLDYLFIQPGQPKAKVMSRIILSPKNAKRLAAALNENISRHESRFGVIEATPRPMGDGLVN